MPEITRIESMLGSDRPIYRDRLYEILQYEDSFNIPTVQTVIEDKKIRKFFLTVEDSMCTSYLGRTDLKDCSHHKTANINPNFCAATLMGIPESDVKNPVALDEFLYLNSPKKVPAISHYIKQSHIHELQGKNRNEIITSILRQKGLGIQPEKLFHLLYQNLDADEQIRDLFRLYAFNWEYLVPMSHYIYHTKPLKKPKTTLTKVTDDAQDIPWKKKRKPCPKFTGPLDIAWDALVIQSISSSRIIACDEPAHGLIYAYQTSLKNMESHIWRETWKKEGNYDVFLVHSLRRGTMVLKNVKSRMIARNIPNIVEQIFKDKKLKRPGC